MRISRVEVLIQTMNKRGSMKINELLSEDLRHPRDISGMAPERVMHSCEGHLLLVTLNSSKHHMSGVERVDEVGREGTILLVLIDRLVI